MRSFAALVLCLTLVGCTGLDPMSINAFGGASRGLGDEVRASKRAFFKQARQSAKNIYCSHMYADQLFALPISERRQWMWVCGHTDSLIMALPATAQPNPMNAADWLNTQGLLNKRGIQ